MQLKGLFSAVCLTSIIAFSANAQKVVSKSTALKSKTDTTATNNPTAKGGGLLADNSVHGNGQIRTEQSKQYAKVPLAGEKAYFGDMNEYVNDFVRKYMESHNRTLSSVQGNSATPFSVIDEVLAQKNMPKELKYLAVIESALNNNAVSHAGAVGPWQMMETTAKMMGLSVSRKKDERRDLQKSTAAATKYLDYLYSQLNDWLLVIAAYNSGPKPVQKAIEKTGSHNFWEIKEYLPKETQGHVLAFIATASIFENLSKFISLGTVPMDFKFAKEKEEEVPVVVNNKEVLNKEVPPLKTTTPSANSATQNTVKLPTFTTEELNNMVVLRLNTPISFDVIAHELKVDKKLLNRWNPDYELFENKKYNAPIYKLRFPKDKMDIFLQKKDYLTKLSANIYH